MRGLVAFKSAPPSEAALRERVAPMLRDERARRMQAIRPTVVRDW